MKKALMTAALLSAGIALWAQSPRAFIQEFQGTVEVKAPGSAAWEPAAQGRELTRDTQISTGFKSSALIKLGNSTLTVRPLTRLSLGEIQAAAAGERAEVQLRAGRVRADIAPPAGRAVDFVVRSPTATASVRGTIFEFDTLNLTVNEGTVRFSGADNTAVYVRAGETSSPDPVTGKTAVPVETAAAEAPPLPAGVEDMAIPAALVPSAAAELSVGADWLD
jgi:hypothetical protein